MKDIEFVGKVDGKIKITLTKSIGNVVFIQENITESKMNIDISNFAKRIYILTGFFGDNSVSEK